MAIFAPGFGGVTVCGRYVIQWLPDELSERFQLRRIPLSLFESFNAAPTQLLPTIVERQMGQREVVMMKWGLVPRWSKAGGPKPPAPFNARGESLLEKPMFRSLMSTKRCLVPANGYFEWKEINGKKQPFYFEVKDQTLFAFAGLYDEFAGTSGEPTSSYTIITTAANELSADYHHRMPVILSREDEEEWASPDQTDAHAVLQLVRQFPSELMTARPVSSLVNNVRNNDSRLLHVDDVPGETKDSTANQPGKGQRTLL